MAAEYVPEDLVEQVEHFKEQTGFSDIVIDRVLMGGEYRDFLDHQGKGTLDEYIKRLEPSERPEDLSQLEDFILRDALSEITSDQSIQFIADLEEQLGLSKPQIIGIISGASEGSQELLGQIIEGFRMAKEFENIEELESINQLPNSDGFPNAIAKKLHGLGSMVTITRGDEDEVIADSVHFHFVNELSEIFPQPSEEKDFVAMGDRLVEYDPSLEFRKSSDKPSFADRLESERNQSKDDKSNSR